MVGFQAAKSRINGAVVDAKETKLLEEDGALCTGETGGLGFVRRDGGGAGGFIARDTFGKENAVTFLHVIVVIAAVCRDFVGARGATGPASMLLAV